MRLPWLQEFTDQRGKRRRYVRDSVAGKRIAISAPPFAPEFVEEYFDALRALGLPLREWHRRWRRIMHEQKAAGEWDQHHIVRAWHKLAKPKNMSAVVRVQKTSQKTIVPQANPWDDARMIPTRKWRKMREQNGTESA